MGSRPQGWTPDPWNGSYFPGMNSRPWEWTPDLGNGHFQGRGRHRFSGILPGMVPSPGTAAGKGHGERLGWRRTGTGGWERLPTIPSCSHPAAPEVRTREIPFLLHPGLPPSNPRISRWMGPSCHPRDLLGSSTSHPGIAPADPGGRWIPGILPPGDSRDPEFLCVVLPEPREVLGAILGCWRGARGTFPRCHHPNPGSRGWDSRGFGEKENGPRGRQGTAQPNPSGNAASGLTQGHLELG